MMRKCNLFLPNPLESGSNTPISQGTLSNNCPGSFQVLGINSGLDSFFAPALLCMVMQTTRGLVVPCIQEAFDIAPISSLTVLGSTLKNMDLVAFNMLDARNQTEKNINGGGPVL